MARVNNDGGISGLAGYFTFNTMEDAIGATIAWPCPFTEVYSHIIHYNSISYSFPVGVPIKSANRIKYIIVVFMLVMCTLL